MMPWACFVCNSMSARCGHREPELVAAFATPSLEVEKPVETAKQAAEVLRMPVRNPNPEAIHYRMVAR